MAVDHLGKEVSIGKNGEARLRSPWWEPVLVVFLFLYPLRHIQWGIDWWDTGYNYANFAYAGLEHMDPMWFFSTYLSNVVGHFMTLLPKGNTLVGMNLYTGLTVSVLALMGYLFCTRKLQIPRGIVFLGELVAISLCWCPTALLYNYLTYILFLGCVILLYIGLTEEKMWCLFAAGLCLGANVLVRFSNLPEAAMIVAVWAYVILLRMEAKKANRSKDELPGMRIAVRYTLWCLGGYLAALMVLLSYIFLKYGAKLYVSSVMRLFAMTENATDYKATSMLEGMVAHYIENIYWVLRMGVFVAVGIVGFALLKWLLEVGKASQLVKKAEKVLWALAYAVACCIAVVMILWLYKKGFCSLEFYSYGSMLWPGITFLMLTLGIAFVRVVYPKTPIQEKLISGMVILVVLLTSLGSNNKAFPSMNNLFVAAPFTIWQCYKFIRYAKSWRGLHPFPAKAALVGFLGLFLFQIGGFGLGFVFAEGTGLQDVGVVIENNEVLTGVKMSPQRAACMEEISAYVEENDLKGKEVIPYGWIPAVCYYLEMPPAFNSWSDLDSYQYDVMDEAMLSLREQIEAGKTQCPVIILDKQDLSYQETAKFQLISDFIEEYNYDLTYQNQKFMLYEAK